LNKLNQIWTKLQGDLLADLRLILEINSIKMNFISPRGKYWVCFR